MYVNFIYIFLFSSLFLFLTRKIAKNIGLVDKPNHRKQHQGQIPLVGGISIYASICFTFLFTNYHIPNILLYLMCAGILVITGIFDDFFNISILIRFIIQALLAIIMMLFSGRYITSLGHIFGSYEVILGPFGYFVTLFAVWGVINAFNMMDGIDGLLGGISCVSLAATGILLVQNNNFDLGSWCFAIIAAILPYILLNLGMLGWHFKVFMGDAGSTMIGFTIIWLLLQGTQGHHHSINPVTALWIIAIPLMDMITIIYRRICKGSNPFIPDHQHIHYIIMRAGFSSHQTLIIITLTSSFLAFFGILSEHYFYLSESIMMLLWIIMLIIYNYILKYTDQIFRLIKKI